MSNSTERMYEDRIYNRIVLLEAMNNYILNVIGDEDVSMEWWEEGVPDECDDNIYQDIAECDESWQDCVKVFARIIRRED